MAGSSLATALFSEAKARFDALEDSSQEEVFKRATRLLKEGYSEETSIHLAMGDLPEDIKKWPPRPRYELHQRMLSGESPRDAEASTRDAIRAWFDRNHESR